MGASSDQVSTCTVIRLAEVQVESLRGGLGLNVPCHHHLCGPSKVSICSHEGELSHHPVPTSYAQSVYEKCRV